MAKETFISKKLEAKINLELTLEENFNIIADFLAEEFAIKLTLCHIIGNRRWSYAAGYSGVMAKRDKIKIKQELGIIYSQDSKIEAKADITSNQWTEIIALIKKIAKKAE